MGLLSPVKPGEKLVFPPSKVIAFVDIDWLIKFNDGSIVFDPPIDAVTLLYNKFPVPLIQCPSEEEDTATELTICAIHPGFIVAIECDPGETLMELKIVNVEESFKMKNYTNVEQF